MIWLRQGPEIVKEHGLSSPLRQTFYLQGLMMCTPEPDVEQNLTEEEWARVLELLNIITDSYVASAISSVAAGEVPADRAMVANMAFIQRFMNGRIAVGEQLERVTRGLCSPFDDKLQTEVGISSTDALAIVNWLAEKLIARWGQIRDSSGAMKKLQKLTLKKFKISESFSPADLHTTPEYVAAESDIAIMHDGIVHPNCILVSDMEAQFGKEKTAAFLHMFALRRGQCEGSGFRYFASPKPSNPAELAPLVLLPDDDGQGERICAPLHAMLYNAVYDSFEDVLGKGEAAEKYLKKRGEYLELRANELIASLFPEASHVLNEYYETAQAGNEHDGFILVGRTLIVLEEKASEMKMPSRDLERSYRNLKDQFKSNRGIQHAYNQASNVVCLIEDAAEPVRFYDKSGRILVEIPPGSLDEIFTICVTLESFGVLATDLTMLLDVSAGKPYPLVVNLFDLENIVDGFQRKGLGGAGFLRYLRQRRETQGRVISDDELHLAGMFLVNGKLSDPPANTVEFVNNYADLFDDLFYQKHGYDRDSFKNSPPGGVKWDMRESLRQGRTVWLGSGDSAPTIRVGPNKKCPCGSHKKFKACCGRVI